MPMADTAAEERRRRRAGWPGGLTTVAKQSDAAIVRHGTPGERIAMVWRVTRDVWASSGRVVASYPRDQIVGRIIRPPHG